MRSDTTARRVPVTHDQSSQASSTGSRACGTAPFELFGLLELDSIGSPSDHRAPRRPASVPTNDVSSESLAAIITLTRWQIRPWIVSVDWWGLPSFGAQDQLVRSEPGRLRRDCVHSQILLALVTRLKRKKPQSLTVAQQQRNHHVLFVDEQHGATLLVENPALLEDICALGSGLQLGSRIALPHRLDVNRGADDRSDLRAYRRAR